MQNLPTTQRWAKMKTMTDARAFRAAWAGVLFAVLITLLAKSESEKYESYILICVGLAIPFAVFRTLISGHPNEKEYKAASGFSLQFAAVGTLGAVALLIMGRSCSAGIVFLISSLICCLLMRYGRRARPVL